MTVNDDIATKLAARYLDDETNGTALLQRYRSDNALDDWEEYVAHVAGASTSNNFVDDQAAFWAAFVP